VRKPLRQLVEHDLDPPQLSLLEQYTSRELSFGEFLEMLPAMRVRQYSISSSPGQPRAVLGHRGRGRCTGLVGAENRVTVPDQDLHGRPTAPSSSRASQA
jgi:hypothetical protein